MEDIKKNLSVGVIITRGRIGIKDIGVDDRNEGRSGEGNELGVGWMGKSMKSDNGKEKGEIKEGRGRMG